MILATLEVADRYLNHPQIKPAHEIPQDLEVSLEPVWADVVCFEFPSGCIAFHRRGVRWELHLMMVPNAGNPYRCTIKALRAMFDRDDCQTVVGRIPQNNTKAIRLGRLCGFTQGEDDGAYACLTLTKQEFQGRN